MSTFRNLLMQISGKEPTPYTELEYIESTGTQYINTLYNHNTEITKYELDFMITAITEQYNTVFGARTSYNSGDAFYLGIEATSPYNAYACMGGNYWANTNWHPVLRTKYHVDFYPGVGLTVDNNTTYMPIYSTNKTTCAYTDYMFALNQKNQILEPIKMKLYSFKIKENDTLVRDFIPVLDENNVPCLYDKVTKNYFYNDGTGTFDYGTL